MSFMPPSVSALLTSLLHYMLLGAALAGLGRTIARGLRLGFAESERFFAHIWLGWAVAIALLQFWHLFGRIGVWAALVVYGSGLVLFAFRIVRQHGKRAWRTGSKGYWLLLLLLAGWVAMRAMLAPTLFDSGLYHFPTVRWLNEHPVIPGLGNLHSRLALNQTFFLWTASLNMLPPFGHGHNIAVALPLLLLVAECLIHARLPGFGRGSRAWVHADYIGVLTLLFIPLLIFKAATTSLSSPSPDTACFMLQMVLCLYLVRLLLRRERDTRGARSLAAFVIVLATVSVTVKLSNIAFAAVIAVIAACVLVRKCGRQPACLARRLGPVLALSLLIALPWMGRGVLLSGFPLYPSNVLRVPVDWALSAERTKCERRIIRAWAIAPGEPADEVLASSEWVVPWVHRTLRKQGGFAASIPLLILIIATAVSASTAWLCRRRPRGTPTALGRVLMLPVGASLVFWFLMAPDTRFAGAQFWILAAAAAADAATRLA